jgi:hypothetical protein
MGRARDLTGDDMNPSEAWHKAADAAIGAVAERKSNGHASTKPSRSTKGSIRGLTLWRPWPWSILVGSKRIENRPWWHKNVEGSWIALHAGKRWDDSGARKILEIAHQLAPFSLLAAEAPASEWQR